jgi:hypothetical protein
LYPHIFKVIGTFTLGIVLSLTASADSDAIRPVSAGNEVSANTAANTGRSAATSITGGLQRLEELNLLSGALVEKAGSGSTPAHEFRIEARMYRELLRWIWFACRHCCIQPLTARQGLSSPAPPISSCS